LKADTQTIDILLLGSGGREHALAAKLAASPRAGKLYIAPGNGGTASCGETTAILRPWRRLRRATDADLW
jgi:phosphoribosylamine--glycine ligase